MCTLAGKTAGTLPLRWIEPQRAWSLKFSSFSHERFIQCSFVYPYPSVSDLAGGNSDHGPRKTQTKTQATRDSVFIRKRRNSDHGLSFWSGKTQTMVWVWHVFGVGVDEGALIHSRLKTSFSLETFNLDLENSPQFGPLLCGSLEISFSIEGFILAWKFQSWTKILNFFNLWVLWVHQLSNPIRAIWLQVRFWFVSRIVKH